MSGAILTPIYQSTTYIQGAPPPAQRPSASRAQPIIQPSSRRVQLTLTFRVRRQLRSACPPHPSPAHAASAAAESIEEYLDKGFSYARTAA